jgi:hypothetical protein
VQLNYLDEYLVESGKAVSESVKRHITEHRRQLKNLFEEYFQPNNDNNWLRNPFIGSFQMEDFSINEYQQLIL